ncbi:MAG: methyltransferase domain-containing protein [Acidimicrobiales bacterium]
MNEEHASDLEALRDAWHRFGELDPLYAILTPDDKRLGGWDQDDFFATGAMEIREALAFVESVDVHVNRGKALDFGCGVGRLTQALCGHFETCIGVDIAPSMIASARRYNQFGPRAQFICSGGPTLPFAEPTFDFVYSRLVLQHIPPSLTLGYVGELVRSAKPAGVLLLQTTIGLAPMGSAPHLEAAHCAARVTVVEPPTSVRASERFTLSCVVENMGSEAWRSVGFHQVRLGNHWLSADGECAVRDDGRAMFPHDLGPGERVVLELTLAAPARAGDYLVELDIVEEGLAWFADRGSPTLRLPLRVRRPSLRSHLPRRHMETAAHETPPTASTLGPTTYDIPPVHVYWVEENELRAVIESAGGGIVAERDDPAVSGYISKQYCIVRR